jgi:hypothetical protein
VNLPDLAARCRRLETLTIGLMRESQIMAAGDDPLLYLERRAYLMGLQAACSGLENARVILAKARQRIECPERYGRPRPGARGEAGWDTA